jgi:hypothetical protein
MHGSLRDALAVLMRELFDELIILQQNRPSRPCRDGVLIVGDGIAGAGSECRAFGHERTPLE